MKYRETGFRALYHNFSAWELTDKLRPSVRDFPDAAKADCLLTYGYIDHEAGLTLEVLAAGKRNKRGFRFFDGNDSIRFFIRIGAVENEEFVFLPDKNGTLRTRYSEKIEMLKGYNVSEEIEKTRGMKFLDGSRHSSCIDDVLVCLTAEGLQPEGCWTRICGLGEHYFMGILLNEPDQNFGFHAGEQYAFGLQETEDKKVICHADLTPRRKLTAKDLEDGSLLKEAVIAFNQDRTREKMFSVLVLLRDSYVWVPCTAELGEQDQAEMEKLVKDAGNDLDSLTGVTVTMKDSIRMKPDILQAGDEFFFPVFSSVDEMGDYGQSFSKVQKHMLEVIGIARNNSRHLSGIVLNAFTESFIVVEDLFDVVEHMESRLDESSNAL